MLKAFENAAIARQDESVTARGLWYDEQVKFTQTSHPTVL